MIWYRNETIKTLIEICILLLKAHREEIEVKELNKIAEKHFGITNVADILIKRHFAKYKIEKGSEWDNELKKWVTKGWDEQNNRWKKIYLPYPIKIYQSVLEKIINKELAYIPEEVLRGDFRDFPIRKKLIWGIGEKAIVLVDNVEYHEECAHPRTAIGRKKFINYKKDKTMAEKLAKEILDKYGE